MSDFCTSSTLTHAGLAPFACKEAHWLKYNQHEAGHTGKLIDLAVGGSVIDEPLSSLVYT